MFGFGHYISREEKLKARVSVFLGLATIFERRGKFEKAERFLNKAMKLDTKLQRLLAAQ